MKGPSRKIESRAWPLRAVRIAAIAVSATSVAACGAPHPRADDSARAADAGYLAPDARIDAVTFLHPPPDSDSAAQRHDEATATAGLALRGTPRWSLAADDAVLSFPEAGATFECALGVPLSDQHTPATLRMLRTTLNDVVEATHSVKAHYRRARPFMVNHQPLCTPEDEEDLRSNGAYPSGHASLGWLWSLVLADVAPDRTEPLLSRGRDFGESRIVCNVHWRSDVLAGRELADAMAVRIRAAAAYRRDLDAARREIARPQAVGVRSTRDCAREAAVLGSAALPAE
ncbi:MAG: phosphatase PAP2 family protein [Dehalococcoidia bacterium]